MVFINGNDAEKKEFRSHSRPETYLARTQLWRSDGEGYGCGSGLFQTKNGSETFAAKMPPPPDPRFPCAHSEFDEVCRSFNGGGGGGNADKTQNC